jgi:hypothetical protein
MKMNFFPVRIEEQLFVINHIIRGLDIACSFGFLFDADFLFEFLKDNFISK